MELARSECECTVLENNLKLDDLREADEAFCCGTGAVITPVGCVSVLGKDGNETEVIKFGDGETGAMTRKLFDMLTGIQSGSNVALANKYSHWIRIVDP
jgi:branched-chain amino acid aminotransferase